MADTFTMQTACQFCGKEHPPTVACDTVVSRWPDMEEVELAEEVGEARFLRIEALRAASRLWGGLLSNENVEPSETVEKAMLASANQFLRWLRDE